MSRFRDALIPLALVAVLVACVAGATGTGRSYVAELGGWVSDGAAHDTFWDTSMIDLPGLSLYQVHCHGMVHIDFQVGATGPNHNNPCYAAMGVYQGSSEQEDVMAVLPGGAKALYRRSVDDGPWTYYIGDVIY